MKRLMLATILLMLLVAPVCAQMNPDLITLSGTSYIVTTVSGVSSISGATNYAVMAYTQVQGGAIRYFLDGTTPTKDNGFLAYDGDFVPTFTPYDVQGFRFIADASAVTSGATVYVILKGRK